MHGKREVVGRFELVEIRFEADGVGAEIHELLTLDQAANDFVDLRMQQRLAARNRNHGRAAFFGGRKAFGRRKMAAQHFDRMLDLAAARAREVAAKKRFEHKRQGILLASHELLFDDVSADHGSLLETH